MLLFWFSWFEYRFIKLDQYRRFPFSRVLSNVVQACAWRVNHALHDAQNVCALIIEGTVFKGSNTVKN